MNFEGKPQSLLTFRVGPVLCCAPSLPVRSIITPPKLTHVAGSEPSTPGIFKHGSHIVKVLDLRLKFGVDEAEHTHPGNLIVSISDAGDFAFWVDQILDVFDFPKEGWGNLPPAIPRGIFTHTLLLNNKIHLYSEFEKLATIPNLGYLEHYIQQLSEKKTAPAATGNNASTDKKSLSTASLDNEVKPVSTSISHAKTTITDNSIPVKAGETAASQERVNHAAVNNITTSAISAKSAATTPRKTGTAASTSSKDSVETTNKANQDFSTTAKKDVFKSAHAEQPGTRTFESIKHDLAGANPVAKQSTSNSAAIQTGNQAGVNKHSLSASTVSPAHKKIEHTKTVSALMTDKMKTDKSETAELAPASTTASPDNAPEYESDSSAVAVILFFILLLLLPAGGIYYYFSQQNAKPYRAVTEQITDKNAIEVKETTIVTNKEIKPGIINQAEVANAEPVKKAEPLETEHHDVTETGEVTAPTSKPFVKPGPITSSGYYADIKQNENEITITINRPAADAKAEQEVTVIKPLPIEDVLTQSQQEQNKTGNDDKPEEIIAVVDPSPVKTLGKDEIARPMAQEKVIDEIVHVVVKGDTLWAIAKKYVKDPFLYPELARLSNIKNPHRIYPGNRVRIRFTNN